MLPGLAPVASRRILACRDTLAAGLAIRHAGLHRDDDPGETVRMAHLPEGVGATVLTATAAVVAPFPAANLAALHGAALARAWADGAWDVRIDLLPPLEDLHLGLVTAGMDYALDPDLREILMDAAGRGRLATWLWRPMRDGSQSRRLMHGTRDTTLGADGGREGDPPARKAPDLGKRKPWSWTIRLGTPAPGERPEPRPPYSPPATRKQRACIAALQYAAGATRPDIPARLTMREASAIIDRLKGETHA